jgi:hypothetical protein
MCEYSSYDDIYNTQKPEMFEEFVQSKIKLRQLKVLKTQKLTIDVLHEFKSLFNSSQMVMSTMIRCVTPI